MSVRLRKNVFGTMWRHSYCYLYFREMFGFSRCRLVVSTDYDSEEQMDEPQDRTGIPSKGPLLFFYYLSVGRTRRFIWILDVRKGKGESKERSRLEESEESRCQETIGHLLSTYLPIFLSEGIVCVLKILI